VHLKLQPHPDLEGRVQKLTSILDVAKAMVANRDLDSLLPMILDEAGKVVDADRCSLFVLDRDRRELWTKIAQGASGEIRVPLGSGIAGRVAQTGVAINLADAYADERFNRTIDRTTGYQTRNILCVPMRDAAGEVTGVIQALNKRGNAVFTAEDEELLLALAGQAAVAIENALLLQEIQRLFEGFVAASVVAIESRDPSTAGHSSRVASLTLHLAEAVERGGRGQYAGVRFDRNDVQEIRYASLLHDFGKVGVREAVLLKPNKLHPEELTLLESRFELVRKDRQLESYKRRMRSLALLGPQALADINREEETRLREAIQEIDEALQFIVACNRPTVLPRDGFEKLKRIRESSYQDSLGAQLPLLTDVEVERLSISRGSLSPAERSEIESHVTHTFRFLSQIPWTRALRRVPEIAFGHHERLDGSGYPRGVGANDIPIQSRMMAIADVYDALTAGDRPYKKAVAHATALDILDDEARRGLLDSELLKLFVEADVPAKAAAQS
jgi:HD-GYP domain-containing protein (c-di-GMP phosphodiesterase class II)